MALEYHRRIGRQWLVAVFAGLGLVVLALGMVAANPLWFLDTEELVNATVGRELLAGNGALLLQMQHNPHCGGCTVMAIGGAVSFRLAGESFLAWKAVPAIWSAATMLVGFALLRAGGWQRGAWAWLVLFIGLPAALFQTLLMGWGNHAEVVLFVLLQALVAVKARRPRDWVLLGVVAGLGAWFCFSSIFALPTILLVLRPWRRLPFVGLGVLLGALPLGVFMLDVDADPFLLFRMTPRGDPGTLLGKLGEATLLGVDSLHFVPDQPWPAVLGLLSVGATWLLAAVALKDPRSRVLASLYGVSALLYVLSSFHIGVFEGGPPRPVDLRYLMSAAVLLSLLASAGADRLSRSRRWLAVAIALVCVAAGPGLAARAAWLAFEPPPGSPGAADLRPTYYKMVVRDLAHDRPPEVLDRVAPSEWVSRVNHHRIRGMQIARRLAHEDDVGGVLDEVRAHAEPELLMSGVGREVPFLLERGGEPAERRIASLLEQASPVERELIAAEVLASRPSLLQLLELPRPENPDQVEALLSGPLAVGDCALCAGLGRDLARVRPSAQVAGVGGLIVGGEAMLPEMRRGVLIEGAGFAYGQQYGHVGPEIELVARLSAEDRAAFQRGYDLGRARAWRVAQAEDAGPTRVP